jgi:hypothetical protein
MSYDQDYTDAVNRQRVIDDAIDAEKHNTRPSGWRPKGRSKYTPHDGAKQRAKSEKLEATHD